MSLYDDFMKEYDLRVPDYLPEPLAARVEALSTYADKGDRMVYLVRDKQSGEPAVLKITLPGSPDSVAQEAALLEKLDHPSIPRVLYADVDAEGREFLLRTYAEGETLQAMVEREEALDARRSMEIGVQIAEIIAYLHAQQPPIIYRDLKPGNVLRTEDGALTLIDFGVSREYRAGKDFDTMYLGTAQFAAPEQFGFSATDVRSDVYALGKLLFYLNTGSTALPRAGELVSDKRLLKIITRCTALSPEKRYASVEKLIAALRRALNPPTRREYAAGAAVAAAVVVLGLALLLPALRDTSKDASGETDQPEALASDGSQYADEASVAVQITALDGGKALADCAVSADSHHWYAPTADGVAELLVYPYDACEISVAAGNRVVTTTAAVSREGEMPAFTLDLADAPEAPEFTEEVRQASDADLEITLPVSGATSVTLWGDVPPGFDVVEVGSDYVLRAAGPSAAPGHYAVYYEATNAYGRAEGVLSLTVQGDAALTPVRTAEDLSRVRENLGGHYVLEADIDMSEYGVFTPIGTDAEPFTGVLDGNGHSISGLTIEGERTGNLLYYGLFGVLENAVVKDLTLTDAQILVRNDFDGAVGFIAGRSTGSLITGCRVASGSLDADIAMESSAGGAVGVNGGIILGFTNEAPVRIFTAGSSKDRTETYAGGIAGTNTGYIADCTNAGSVTGIAVAGGCAGLLEGGILTRCTNSGVISCPDFMNSWKPGGIVHLIGHGRRVSDCTYTSTTAPTGVSVWNYGTVINVKPT
jgi:hypothetical protein